MPRKKASYHEINAHDRQLQRVFKLQREQIVFMNQILEIEISTESSCFVKVQEV